MERFRKPFEKRFFEESPSRSNGLRIRFCRFGDESDCLPDAHARPAKFKRYIPGESGVHEVRIIPVRAIDFC